MTILKVALFYHFFLQLQFEILLFFFKEYLYNFAVQKRRHMMQYEAIKL